MELAYWRSYIEKAEGKQKAINGCGFRTVTAAGRFPGARPRGSKARGMEAVAVFLHDFVQN